MPYISVFLCNYPWVLKVKPCIHLNEQMCALLPSGGGGGGGGEGGGQVRGSVHGEHQYDNLTYTLLSTDRMIDIDHCWIMNCALIGGV